jgi:hypothetical protein
MEEHPDYGKAKAELEAAGYKVVPGDPPPHVERVQYVDGAGNAVGGVHQRVVVQPGMRFLDLEHEAGHVRQFRDRFGGDPPLTDRLVERPGRPPRPANDQSGVLSNRQNDIAEFHNRLQEYNRLAQRRVSPEILTEHAREMSHWYEQYRKAVIGWKGAETRQTPWAREHFSDIASLMNQYKELGGTLSRGIP